MRYESPNTMEAAVSLMAAETGAARVLAGGTDLLVQLRSGRLEPELIVDLKRIAGIRSIAAEGGGFRIGAAASSAEMSEHAELSATWPGVVEAAALIGSAQIQGRATLAGNLCNGSPAADSVPAMVAAGATAAIAGPSGKRAIPVEEIPSGPGETCLAPGEIVESIFLPKPQPRTGDAYLRFIPRTEMDIAVVGAGICVTLDESGVCSAARVALGAVAERVILVREAADALVGTALDEAALADLAAAASAACRPIDDKRGTRDYRIQVAGVLARRAAAIARDRAKGK